MEPLAGLTLSMGSESLTDRRGWYHYHAGSFPISRPDLTFGFTSYGFGTGADLVLPLGGSVSASVIGRLHWTHRPAAEPGTLRSGPDVGSLIFHVGAGLRWSPPGRRGPASDKQAP